MGRTLLSSAVAAVAICLLAPAVAGATTIEALDLRGLVRGADHVVVATVIRAEAHYDDLDRIVTDTTLRVDESMYGEAGNGSTIVVRRIGGVLGDVGLRIEGEATFELGERVLLFAVMAPRERILRAVGMSQGVLPIRRVEGAEMVMPGGSGLALVQRSADGTVGPAPGALLAPASLDELLERVRELVREIHDAR